MNENFALAGLLLCLSSGCAAGSVWAHTRASLLDRAQASLTEGVTEVLCTPLADTLNTELAGRRPFAVCVAQPSASTRLTFIRDRDITIRWLAYLGRAESEPRAKASLDSLTLRLNLVLGMPRQAGACWVWESDGQQLAASVEPATDVVRPDQTWHVEVNGGNLPRQRSRASAQPDSVCRRGHQGA